MIEDADYGIVARCLEGDKSAYEEIVERYHKTVFNVAYRMVNNSDDAQDVTQSVFIKSYENLRSFDRKYKFFSWLYRIAVNESLNHINRRRKLAELTEDILAREGTPSENYDGIEQSAYVEQALMRLSLDHRTVLVLKYFEDLSYAEIGYILDLPEKTVKSRLFSARQVLKDILQKRV